MFVKTVIHVFKYTHVLIVRKGNYDTDLNLPVDCSFSVVMSYNLHKVYWTNSICLMAPLFLTWEKSMLTALPSIDILDDETSFPLPSFWMSLSVP